MALNHCLSLGPRTGGQVPLFQLHGIATDIGFKLHNCAVWVDRTLSKSSAWGSWMSASSPYICSPFEGVLLLYKERWKKNRRGSSDISREDFIHLAHGVWDIRTETKGRTKANFSEDFAEKTIKLLSYVDDLVLDPFAGSGTVAAMCAKNHRRSISIEQSARYCRVILDRLYESGGIRRMGGVYVEQQKLNVGGEG